MTIIENEFSKELSDLLTKHKKKLVQTKEGLAVSDSDCMAKAMIRRPTTPSDGIYDLLIFCWYKK